MNGREVCAIAGTCVVWLASQTGHVDGSASFPFSAATVQPVFGVTDGNLRQVRPTTAAVVSCCSQRPSTSVQRRLFSLLSFRVLALRRLLCLFVCLHIYFLFYRFTAHAKSP